MKPSHEILYKAGLPTFNGQLEVGKIPDMPTRNIVMALLVYLDEQHENNQS